MTITITVQTDLAQRLESAAMQQNISVEELATSILDRAVARPENCWSEKNQRRLCLIRKSVQQTLSTDEQRELRDLQSELDSQFEEFDEALQSQLDLIRSVVQGA